MQREKAAAVLLVAVDIETRVALRHDMMQGAGIFEPTGAGYRDIKKSKNNLLFTSHKIILL
ncbi:hypothetical protein N9F34_03055 [Alphaproteobacteria bacterium]|nr:hypothetical protein [Alphaproteobacteria bacterium]